jgi:hypothetical protein
MEKNIIWAHLLEPGLEHLHLFEGSKAITINSLIVGLKENHPFRVQYEIVCDTAWHVRKLNLYTLNGMQRSLELESDGEGNWLNGRGEEVGAMRGCLNLDLAETPFTSSLAINQLGLAPGAKAEIKVARISLPELFIQPLHQCYTYIGDQRHNRVYHCENEYRGWAAEFYLDDAGMVTDYPGTFIRVWPRAGNQGGISSELSLPTMVAN